MLIAGLTTEVHFQSPLIDILQIDHGTFAQYISDILTPIFCDAFLLNSSKFHS